MGGVFSKWLESSSTAAEGWLAGASLNTALEGESSCLFPLLISVTAEIEGWPASHRHLCGMGSTLVLGDHEASSAPEVGRAETLQQRKISLFADEKAGKGIWAEIPGLSRAGAERPWPLIRAALPAHLGRRDD